MIGYSLTTTDHHIPGKMRPPVFIVGAPHSGTSLLLAMLDSHPSLYGVPRETKLLFNNATFRLEDCFDELDSESRTAGKFRWVEKTPHHVFYLHKLFSICPEAKVLFIVRHPWDVACSYRKRDPERSWSSFLRQWLDSTRNAVFLARYSQVKVLRYEDLIINTEKTIRNVCDHLDEPFDPAMMTYHQKERRWYHDTIAKPDDVATMDGHLQNRNWQINQPIFNTIGSWTQLSADDYKSLVSATQDNPDLDFAARILDYDLE